MANTRIQCPVTDEAKEMLQIYGKASGKSLSAVCGEILEQTAPVMLDMAKAFEQAKSAPAAAMRTINKTLQEQLDAIDADQLRLDMTPVATGKKKKA